jgi:hypothetical protein
VDCITVSHNKSADFRLDSTLLFKVLVIRKRGVERVIEAPGGADQPTGNKQSASAMRRPENFWAKSA